MMIRSLNPWDYVLMFEGALMFAGAAARRLSVQGGSKAVFPFTVDNSAAGYGTVNRSQSMAIRPGLSSGRLSGTVPDQPTRVEHLMSEGRAQLGRKQVSSGSDFARAVTRSGD